MSDISVTMALAMVELGLKDDVTAAVADSHAATALRAALTILKNVRAELEAGDGWQRTMLQTTLPLAERWPNELRAVSTQAADAVTTRVAEARDAATSPARAHALVLESARICFETTWLQSTPNRTLLTELRRVTRLDAEARAAFAR